MNSSTLIQQSGKVHFDCLKDTMKSDELLIATRRRKRKVIMILDNLRMHHCAPVKKLLDKYRSMMEVFYFPAHSPRLNSDEYLNSAIKAEVYIGIMARNEKRLQAIVIKPVRRLLRKPIEKIISSKPEY